MREKEDYRANLERLNDIFPDKEILSISETAKFLGLNRQKISQDWKDEFITIGKGKYISKSKIARLIS